MMNDPMSSLSQIPGPDSIHAFRLDNGVQVLSYENRNAETVYAIGILANGGGQDPPSKTGLAHFTASLLSRGTENTSFNAFHAMLEAAGANLSFSCSSRNTWFRGKALAEDTDLLFKLAADGLRYPAFKDEYVERLRRQLIAGLALRDQDTGEVASLLFDQYLFQDHPYALPVDGFTHTIKDITRRDIIDFHRTFYSPAELIIVVSGAISADTVKKLANQYFGDWVPNEQPVRMNKMIPSGPTSIIRKHKFLEGKSQLDLILGSFGPSRTSTDYLPATIGNNILGQFGLMGRIGRRVRTDAGLAYFASSSINAWEDTGTWDISAGVNPQNTEKAIALIREEIKEFISEKVTEEELSNTKSHLTGRMPIILETNAGIANAILTMYRFDLGFDYYRRYKDLVNTVTSEDIMVSARKYLHPDKLLITSAGPGKDVI
jgi:zinc protease